MEESATAIPEGPLYDILVTENYLVVFQAFRVTKARGAELLLHYLALALTLNNGNRINYQITISENNKEN